MAKVALLIGVSEYEPGLNPLPAAVKDIEALRRVLQDPEMGGFDQVKTLANPESHIMQYEIETLFDGRTKDDLVLLFFSGHGIKDDTGRLYFASRNTRKNKKGNLVLSTAVPTNFVHNIMNGSQAKRQAIILDCCFSGAFDPALQAKDDGSVDLRSQLGAEGRVVLASSSSTEYSFEQQGSDLSLYTRYLVEGIETGAGDLNEDGFVSARELHEYAASKVQETAPKMTPKIIFLKDKGFEIFLSKTRVTDPKLRYRKATSRYANSGSIRPAGRAYLNSLREQLGLSAEETTAIETEVLRPYQERLKNLQNYREALVAESEYEYPLSGEACEEMVRLQELWGLRDEDILPIQQGVETQFFQKSVVYQRHLAEYGQAFADAIQQDFPLSSQVRQSLEKLQQSLGLKAEDIARIEQPLIQQAELKHQQKLIQAAEQQRQVQEKAEYENRLLRYEQEFIKAVQTEYPLNQFVANGLMTFQQQLGLKNEDVTQIEQPIREPLEAKYRENLKQQEQAEQKQKRELEERRKAEQEKLRQEADQQRQELEKAEYGNKLRRYEQEFAKKIQAEYPLNQFVLDGLKTFQQQLGLKNEEVTRIEQPIRDPVEAKYQEELRQQEQAKQQQIKEAEERRKAEEQEKQRLAQEKAKQQAEQERLQREQRQAEEQERQRQAALLKQQEAAAAERQRQQELELQRREEERKKKAAQTVGADELASEKGVDYTKLRDLLKDGRWKEANQETAKRMYEVMDRQAEGYLRVEDIENFPCQDLRNIDRLWVKYSQGKFGFSVQKEIWQTCSSPTTSNKDWEKFGVAVGWRTQGVWDGSWVSYSQLTFNLTAPRGHLPAREGDDRWVVDGGLVLVSLASKFVDCSR